MGHRENGLKTRYRVLEAACLVFAEKGYRAATVAEICKRAGADIAAANYHFGDKETLYREAWEHAFHECAVSELPSASQGSAEDRLRDYIHALIEGFAERGRQSNFIRLYLMEVANPTGLIGDKWKQLIEPRRRSLLKIIQEIMEKETIDEEVILCEMSVMTQCRALLTVSPTNVEHLMGRPLSPDLIRRLADHVTRFSLAGIKATAAS